MTTAIEQKQQRLTLVICTYRRPEQVKRLLVSVECQAYKPDQILIIDGSEDDATAKVLQTLLTISANNLSVEYYKVSPDQKGLTRQRNIGISLAKGEIIAFLDDDTVLKKDYFMEILECFERHPEAVGIGGLIVNEIHWRHKCRRENSLSTYGWENWERRDDLRWRLRKLLRLDSPLPPGWMPPFGHGRSASYPPDSNDYPVEFIMGGASAWKRSIFSQIRFSHYFEGYGLYEDLDFSIRANRGGKIFVCTRAQLEHYHASGGRPDKFRYGKMVERNGWFVWRQRWKSPAFVDRVKYWMISLLLAFLRLIDIRGGGPLEAAGRLAGAFSVLIDPPRE